MKPLNSPPPIPAGLKRSPLLMGLYLSCGLLGIGLSFALDLSPETRTVLALGAGLLLGGFAEKMVSQLLRKPGAQPLRLDKVELEKSDRSSS